MVQHCFNKSRNIRKIISLSILLNVIQMNLLKCLSKDTIITDKAWTGFLVNN